MTYLAPPLTPIFRCDLGDRGSAPGCRKHYVMQLNNRNYVRGARWVTPSNPPFAANWGLERVTYLSPSLTPMIRRDLGDGGSAPEFRKHYVIQLNTRNYVRGARWVTPSNPQFAAN